MEGVYYLIIGILSFALAYILLQGRMNSMLDQKLKEAYKNQIQSDIQEFYREMESYAAIVENRIGRFQKLLQHQDENLKVWDNIFQSLKKSKTGKEIIDYFQKSEMENISIREELSRLKKEISNLPHRVNSIVNTDINTAKRNQKPAIKDNYDYVPEVKTVTAVAKPEAIRPLPQKEPLFHEESYNPAQELMDDLDDHLKGNKPSLQNALESKIHQTYASGNQLKTKIMNNTPKNLEKNPELKGILSSIGKFLMPILGATPPATTTSLEDFPSESARSNPSVDFSSLLQKKSPEFKSVPMVNPESIYANQTKTSTIAETPKEEIKKNNLGEKKMEPEELLRLLEALRTSSGRPLALKSLLFQGFNVAQISDLSSIPYSDLELTRSLYQID